MVAVRHCAAASNRKMRSVDRETRWRWRLKVLWTAACDGCALVPSALNQDLEDLALMIDRAPQIHMRAGDPDDHFVEMPAITWSRTAPPQSPSDRWSEFEHPAASALVGDVEPTLGKQFLNIAIAQGETKVQPDGVLDDDRWKAMPAIGDRNHDRTLPPDSSSSQAVTLTKPTAAPCRQPTPPAGSPEPRF